MDSILELLAAQVGTLTGKIDEMGSQSIQNVNDNQRTSYSPSYYCPDFHDHQNSPWSYNNQVSCPPEFSYSYPQSQEQESSLEELLVKHIEQNDMRMYNQEVSTPSMPSHTEFWYQPPQQQEDESKVEEILTKYIEQTEVRMNNQDISIRNIANQLEQLTNAIINPPQWTLPSNSEPNPECDGEEHCVVTHSSDNESYVAIGGNSENSYPSVEDASDTRYMGSKTREYEETCEDNLAGNSVGFMQIPSVPIEPFLHPFPNSVECFRIEFIEDIDEMQEFKFGGLQSLCNADPYKEKTKRRHDMMNYARNPD